MLGKKHYDVILKSLLRGDVVHYREEADGFWVMPGTATSAIYFPRQHMYFDISKFSHSTSTEIFKITEAHTLAEFTGVMHKGLKTVCKLKTENADIWVDEKLLWLFLPNKYQYYCLTPLSPIFCKCKVNGKTEGLLMPTRLEG